MLTAVLTACSTPPAPVVERSSEVRNTAPVAKGHYRIRSGDTLHGIAFRFGLDHRDLARWNDIAPPYLIYPDQVLKLSGSAAPKISQAGKQPDSQTKVNEPSARPPPRPAASTTAKPVSKPPASKPPASKPPASQPVTSNEPSKPVIRPAPVAAGDPDSWIWPVDGRILRGFLATDSSRNGLDITSDEGSDIKASAAGSVVYSGNGLIGFGELIIIKHSDQMLSAYAHNRARLVAEGESVQQGQKIAEMGRNDRNETILHFEIRVNGKPVDPRKHLPQR